MSAFFRRWGRDEGQTMAEYAIVLGVIILGVVAAFTPLSAAIDTTLRAAGAIFG